MLYCRVEISNSDLFIIFTNRQIIVRIKIWHLLIRNLIKSCSGTCLSLLGDPRMISGFSSTDYPIPS